MKSILTIVFISFFFGIQPAHANKIYWESGIASTTVGYDKPNKQWVQDRYILAVISTSELISRMDVVHPKCSPTGLKKSQRLVEIRRDIQKRFADFPSLEALTKLYPEISDEVMKEAQLKRLAAFESLIFEALEKTKEAYQACGLKQHELDGLSLALIRRHCGRTGISMCDGNVAKFGGSSSEIGFSIIVDWLDARVTAGTNAEAAKVVLAYDRPTVLVFSGSNAVTFADATPSVLVQANKWPTPPIAEVLNKLSVNAIQQVRAEKKVLLSESLPRLLTLPDRTTVAILDVLTNPRQAFERVERRASDLKQTALAGVADEVARTRIAECRNFLAKSDLQELSHCSGYKLDQVSLLKCMSLNECMPPMDTTSIRRDVALYAEVLNTKQLAVSNMIGRVSSTYSGLVAASNQCKEIGGSTKELAKCLNNKMLPPKAAAFESCVQQSKTNSARIDCVTLASGAQLPIALSKCTASGKDQVACLLNLTLPQIGQDVADLQNCLRTGQSSSQIKNCITKLPLGGDAAKVISCLPHEEKTNTAKLALCLGSDSLPTGVRQALVCFTEGEGALAATAACMVKETLPGVPPEVSKLLSCAAEAQGDPMGTAICSASDSMNAELRIALQCAVSSGGEPSATAACAFGRLTLKELQQCSGKKFGDEGCFGKGNEIQKLAKALLGQEIGPNSVVGQVITFNLTAMKDAVAFSEATFKEGGKLVQDIENEVSVAGLVAERVIGNIALEQEKLIQNTGKAVEQVAQAAGGAVQTVVNNVISIVEQVLPKISFSF